MWSIISGIEQGESMIRPIIIRRKRVIVDVDVQRDLFVADGLACVRNHRRVLMNIRRVMAWARLTNVHVISTILANGNINGQICCKTACPGAEKIRYTLRNNRIFFPADGSTDLSRELFQKYEQVIIAKRTINPFDEPRADRLFTEINAEEIIVVGAAAEGAVRETVLGMLQRGKKVVVLIDATGSHDKNAADIAFRKMAAKGAKLIETRKLVGQSHLQLLGVCECERCRGKVKISRPA